MLSVFYCLCPAAVGGLLHLHDRATVGNGVCTPHHCARACVCMIIPRRAMSASVEGFHVQLGSPLVFLFVPLAITKSL